MTQENLPEENRPPEEEPWRDAGESSNLENIPAPKTGPDEVIPAAPVEPEETVTDVFASEAFVARPAPEPDWLPEAEPPVAEELPPPPIPPEPETGAGAARATGAGEPFRAAPPPPAAPTPPQPPAPPQPLSADDERTFAIASHLSILLNLVTGFLGVAVPLVIYLVYRDRSRYVAFHAMQSFLFQLLWWVGGGILIALAWTITGVLSVVIIGLCLIPFALLLSLLPIAALVYGVIGAIKVGQGEDFSYWLTGDWARSIIS